LFETNREPIATATAVSVLVARRNVSVGINKMKKTALLMLLLGSVSSPVIAKPQFGLAQAKAMAQAAGMTASEERKARQFLLSGVKKTRALPIARDRLKSYRRASCRPV
jgi:hypothetical protein